MTDNIFPLTKEEILIKFPHVFENEFEKRTMIREPWNNYINQTFSSWFSVSYTKGYSTSSILINSKGEKDFVTFWKYYKDGKIQFGYSFTKRELFNTILN